jgi:hypothetical protein
LVYHAIITIKSVYSSSSVFVKNIVNSKTMSSQLCD